MIGKTLILTVCITMGIVFYLMEQLYFLSIYRELIVHQHLVSITAYATAGFINLFAFIFFINRTFFLKDTGKKLELMEKTVVLNGESMPTDFEQWRP